ncbi:MAG: tyrosinase family protein, partial [Betaproteobacteria bacterium]|nr:tyrosinase family protein [Betaproteobacteria bacterium]
TQPPAVTLSGKSGSTGGSIVFYASPAESPVEELTFTLPLNGSSVEFFIAGKFGRPSLDDGDVSIQVRSGIGLIAEVPLMVRIRKDATKLSDAERDRFIAAFARLNNRGTGRFADFRNMHTAAGSPEAHGQPGFLPWHRAYLLDLERELQNIDPSVALPYWRFDRPAPGLFTQDFIGESGSLGTVRFSSGNPLQFWVTDGVQGIVRRPLFDTETESAIDVLSEDETIGLGDAFVDFEEMEGNPHGSAHVSFGGSISSIPTAAKDPLFFLLHANVDRLWAKWQAQFGRFNPDQEKSFDTNAAGGGNRIGHNLPDTMWPWNGITTPPRPPTAPGGGLANSVCASMPGPQPAVRDCFDYQGKVTPPSRLGFDYDDVPYS